MLATQSVLEGKVRCIAMPIGQTWTDIENTVKSYKSIRQTWTDIENTVKSYKGCALAVKVPIKLNLWPKMDLPGSRIYIDFAGPLDGYYYVIVVKSFSKWPEEHRCKNPTTEITIKFLHELFARFGVVETFVSDNGSQFTENLDTSVQHTRLNTSQSLHTIRGPTNRLNDLWIH